jgi:hypothetical protein
VESIAWEAVVTGIRYPCDEADSGPLFHPVIYDFDITVDNPLGRPYMLMSRVRGRQLDKLWFDPIWYNNDRRQNVFRSLAKCMSQLKDLEFSAIECLQLDSATQSCVVGPLLVGSRLTYRRTSKRC